MKRIPRPTPQKRSRLRRSILQNTCNAPLTFSANSISAQDSAPAVVANDAFEDAEWQKLTKTQTLANIAFGFTMPTTGEWLAADNADAWFVPSTALALGDIAGQKHGNGIAQSKIWYGMGKYSGNDDHL